MNINHVDMEGKTALLHATAKGQRNVVSLLLGNRHIDTSIRAGAAGLTALTVAAQHGHKDCLMYVAVGTVCTTATSILRFGLIAVVLLSLHGRSGHCSSMPRPP